MFSWDFQGTVGEIEWFVMYSGSTMLLRYFLDSRIRSGCMDTILDSLTWTALINSRL